MKHSTAGAVAFEQPDWEPRDALPTFELGGVIAGATICHDSYLGLLPRYLAGRGARLWVNPSFDNVTDIKWSSVLRLRAVENRFFALCTLHCDVSRRKTRPFTFAPDGTELAARRAGSEVARPLSECGEAGNIFVVDLDLSTVGEPLDWSTVPHAGKPKCARHGQPRRPVRVALRDGQPCVLGSTGWNAVCTGGRVETDRGPVYMGIIPGARILDAAECFRVLDRAQQTKGAPIIWNHWERLPADSARLATLTRTDSHTPPGFDQLREELTVEFVLASDRLLGSPKQFRARERDSDSLDLGLLDQPPRFLEFDSTGGFEQVDDKFVGNPNHHVVIQIIFSHLPDRLVGQVEQSRAQAVQIVPVGIDKKIDVLGGAYESGLNHGHAAHDDIAD